MPTSKQAKRNMVMAYITCFLDIIGFSLIVPILPYLSSEMNGTVMQEGILFSSYSITQLISLYIMGTYSDKYGRKFFLLFSLAGSCIGAILQALSQNMVQLIIWRAATGLTAGSTIIVQALIADLTSPDERSKYISLNEAFISAAFVLGPAIGGILGPINLRLPLYFAGVIAGIAFVFAFFLLDETNNDIKKINDLMRSMHDLSGDEKNEVRDQIKSKRDEMRTTRQQLRIKPSLLMFLCFFFEFFNRWVVNAYDSRYGFFIKDKFGVTQTQFSIITCCQSALLVIVQGWLYGWLINTIRIPIPHLAICGTVIEIISYFFISFSKSTGGCIAACIILWVGFALACPASISIISTQTEPLLQGTILSYNNVISQCSLIICPLVLSAIYAVNRDATYYYCMIPAAMATILMSVIISYPNSRLFGRQKSDVKSSDIELPEKKVADAKGNEIRDNEIIEANISIE